MSPINLFPNEELYEPTFYESFYGNTAREDTPVEVTPQEKAPVKHIPKKPGKRMTRNDDGPSRQIPRTTEEEIALCKAWVNETENSALGNLRKGDGFWNDIIKYIESKTNTRRTYDIVNGKWNSVRPNVARIFGVYNNLKRSAPISGAGDEDYYNTAMLNYEADYGVHFTLRHCWEVLRKFEKRISYNYI